jgi:hypothetical protein
MGLQMQDGNLLLVIGMEFNIYLLPLLALELPL